MLLLALSLSIYTHTVKCTYAHVYALVYRNFTVESVCTFSLSIPHSITHTLSCTPKLALNFRYERILDAAAKGEWWW